MTFALLASDPSVGAAVARVAREEAEGALAQARGEGPLGPRVHEMRKAVKKLRGLLRLVRPVLREAREENATLREAGRGLSSLRDAAVLLATAEALSAGMDEARREALLRPFRAEARARDEAAEAALLPPFAAVMEGVRDRAMAWRVKGEGWEALAPGLEATWSAARLAQRAALRDPSADATHEWRKRVKDHWYQARLLQPIWPAMMEPHVRAADDLGEVLGQINDLAVLRDRLGATDLAPDLVDEALGLAGARHAALWARAEPLGRRLLAGKASDLSRRWGAWWALRDQP
jgi:CHAD domain-containing protein